MTLRLQERENAAREPGSPFVPCSDMPNSTTPHDRLHELSAILATGIRRLRAIRSALAEFDQTPSNSSLIGLDQGREFALMDAGLRPESEVMDEVH